uniref:F-box domain-containing protein n=1 Tax=Haptolina brevifila TaxID=156173 RepID=A0A7S2IA19_9EUKA|mmetsp:Transcript_63070/g.124672  ORF Transcript_63070/g.124672 Transcript_63070/m.124672 type:complete len:524 (+) Transcript_63070:153-1724(+)|eukprot:CAMPEP_0174739524 /NCGR_PEP_ID=MMETSP1094-20130205/71736_1 /TAXON_ID=156173 /ORGANISM="Chrysochromulina brevifilum, Strain UTEX LB 985" /LENGTH=523 /DNA_ID=CAMNT_0015943099 /DNA_START=145 /DNA_END=1716 /DNA_ORIENTATION=-
MGEKDPQPTTLLDVSTDSFAIIFAHVGVRPLLAELCQLSEVCSTFRSIVHDEATWQILCKYAWSIDAMDVSVDWPRLSSYRTLYALLETWAARQGFYALVDAFPWGALLLLRFHSGQFIGELIYHAPASDGGKCVEQPRVRVLTVDFNAAQPASTSGETADLGTERGTASARVPPWLAAAKAPRIQWCGIDVTECTCETSPPEVLPHTELLRRFPWFEYNHPGFLERSLLPTSIRPQQGGWLSFRSYLSLDVDTTDLDESVEAAQMQVQAAWQVARSTPPPESSSWEQRLRTIAGRGQLTLGLVEGPRGLLELTSVREASGAQLGGLYVGEYPATEYGQYSKQALLIEPRTFDLSVAAEVAELRALFRNDERCVDELRSHPDFGPGASSCTFLVGKKVTGDFHVPMGACTFIALISPKLDASPPCPSAVRTRGGHLPIVRGWSGFGTLAFPGFGNPHFSPGWLVQIEDDVDGCRFAFMFEGRESDPANVLTRVASQSTACYLGEAGDMRLFGLEAAAAAVALD